ncbi:MAG: InlB B-repeat-containing protein [Clostridia bacterium]|nr:InlB B-repeat-containing protein [Clostridia bacterium]
MKKFYKCFLYIVCFSIMFSFSAMMQINTPENLYSQIISEKCLSNDVRNSQGYSMNKENFTQLNNLDNSKNLSLNDLNTNSNISYNFLTTGARNYLAESSLYWTTSTYRITLDDSVGGGIIAFGGEGGGNSVDLAPSGSAILSATPNIGYVFVEWNVTSGSEYITITSPNSATTEITAGSENALEFYNILISATFAIDQNYKYAINYILDGGTASNPDVYTPGTATFTLNNPTKTGYTFDGWSGTDIIGKSTSVTITQGSTGIRTYTASWVENSYFLSYSPNGGIDGRADTSPIGISYTGSVLTLDISAGIVYTGKTLSGWQIQSSEENLQPAENYDVSYIVGIAGKANENGATVTLNAVWTDNLYTIVYELNGGEGNAPSQLNKKFNDNITTVSGSDVSKTGYDFDYWIISIGQSTYEISGNTIYQVSQLASYAGVLNDSTATITLTAEWNLITYNIVYDFNNSQFPSTTYNIENLSKTLPNPTALTGYIFYWVVSETDAVSSWVVGQKFLPGQLNFENFYGNVVFSGEYVANTFTIKYDINGGTGNLQTFEQEVEFNDGGFVFQTTAEISAFAELENYHILGYSINSVILDLTQFYTVSDLAIMAGVENINNSDIVLKLEWRGDEYLIKYYIYNDLNSIYEIVELSPNTHTYGTSTVLALPERTGYTFSGWKLNGSQDILTVLGATAFTADIELYGEYTINSYVIRFYDDLGEFLQQTTINYGEVYEVEDFIPTKASTQVYTFEFDGWYDGILETANEITDFTITGNRNFYAKFLSILQKYTASFYNENGTLLLQESEFDYGTIAIYTGEEQTKQQTAQYTFEHTGWSESIGGEKIEILNVTDDTSFYAYFEATLRTYLLQFYDNDGTTLLFSANKDYDIVVDIATDYVPADKYTQSANYFFDGWYGNINYSGEEIVEILVMQNQQFFAKYIEEINQYTFTFKFYHNATSTEYLVNLAGGANGLIEDDYGTELEPGNLIPEYPTELINEHYNYNFIDWYENRNLIGEPVEQFLITENKTFFAKFTITPKSYNLCLWNENGDNILFEINDRTYGTEIILAQDNGGSITYNDAYKPTKESILEFVYVFAGWYEIEEQNRQGDEQQVLTVFMDDNINLYACFDAFYQVYIINFYDDSGNVIGSDSLEFGSTVLISEIITTTPSKTETVQFTFDFAGWYDNSQFEGDPITEVILTQEYFNLNGGLPTNIYPKFDEILRFYDVFFRNTDETLYQELSVGYGEEAVYNETTPTKNQNLTFYFVFAGWSKEKFSSELETDLTILGTTTYYAYFESEYIEYTLSLCFTDMTVFKTVNGTYYERIELTDNEYEAIKEDSTHLYQFVGWYDNADLTGNEIAFIYLTEENMSLYAKFNVTEISVVLDSQTILIILIGLAVLVVIIVIVVIVSSIKKSGLKKLSRKGIYEIKSEHEQRLKEREELEKRIKEIKEKYKNKDSE